MNRKDILQLSGLAHRSQAGACNYWPRYIHLLIFILLLLTSCGGDNSYESVAQTGGASDHGTMPMNPVLQAVNEITDPTTGMVLVKVPGGTFTMGDTLNAGDTDEKPTHQVTLSDYYIGKYEVTQAQWQAVMGGNPSYFTRCGGNCPVESMTWYDIQNFINKLNQMSGTHYRLPTEAEWEYAARSGGKDELYSGGSNLYELAWYTLYTIVEPSPHPVGQKLPNGLNLYDMSGNISEWVSDWYGNYNSEAQTNPTGPASGDARVNRGGSYHSYPFSTRTTYRSWVYPDFYFSTVGFRLASPAP